MKELGQDFLSKPNTGCRETSEAFITKVIDSAKYPQFKPLINHIEYWDNEAEVIIKEVPLDEYLLEN